MKIIKTFEDLSKWKSFDIVKEEKELRTFIDEINIYFKDFDLEASLLSSSYEYDYKIYLKKYSRMGLFIITDDMIHEFYHIIDHFKDIGYKLHEVKCLTKRQPFRLYDTKQNRWGGYQKIDSIWDIQDLDWKERPIVDLTLTFKK